MALYDYRRTDSFRPFPTTFGPFTLLRIVCRGITRHRPFERVIICACIITSTSLPSPERESHSHTTRDPPLAASFERISIPRTHRATILNIPKRKKNVRVVSLYLNIRSTRPRSLMQSSSNYKIKFVKNN